MAERKITIIAEYVDLSSSKFNASFDKMESTLNRFSDRMSQMNTTVDRTMRNMASEIAKANKTSTDAFGRTRRAADEQIGGIVRLAREYEKIRIALSRVRNALLIYYFTARPLISLINDSIDAFIKQEDASNRLSTALQIQTTYTAALREELDGLASSFQKTTRYGDDAIEEVFQTLISTGDILPSKLKEATQAVLDFSTLTGRDLTASADLVAKAAAGFTGQLSRYGIFIDKNIPKSEKFAEVLRVIESRMGGAAQKDVESYGGKVAQMAENWDNAKENLGKFIITSANLPKWVKQFSDFLEAFDDPGNSVAGLAEKIGQLDSVIEESGKWENWLKFTPLLILVKGEAENLKEEMEALTKRMVMFNQATAPDRSRLKELNKDLEITAKTVHEFFTAFSADESENKTFSQKIDEINTKTKEYNNVAKNFIATEKKIVEAIKNTNEQLKLAKKSNLSKDTIEALETEKQAHIQQLQELIDFYSKSDKIRQIQMKKIQDELGGLPDFTKEFAQASTKALEDGFFNIVTGRFKDMESVVLAFGETLLRVVLRTLAIKAVSSFFTAFTPAAAPGAFVGIKSGFHRGGSVRHGISTSSGYEPDDAPRRFAGRYESGGEVRAILHEGEGVINKQAMGKLGVQNLNRINAGGDIGGGTVVNQYYIQTIDERSFRERLGQHGDIYSKATDRSISDNSNLRRTIQRHT